MVVDVGIIGGGPAGLAAALELGRSRKRVVVFDGGTPRNATAHAIHGFLSRDGTPPSELRHIGHEQLRAYPSVEVRANTLVTAVERAGAKFRVLAGGTEVEARRILLCMGVIDEPLPLDGSRELWGASLFECPYCHAWEVRDRRFGFLAPSADAASWARVLRGWTKDVIVFTSGAFALPAEVRGQLVEAGIAVEERRILTLQRQRRTLTGVVVEGDVEIPRDALFFRPVQRQTPVVAALALALDDRGFVKVDHASQTSIPRIYAAGDMITHYHGALAAAASGSKAAHAINHELTVELVGAGIL